MGPVNARERLVPTVAPHWSTLQTNEYLIIINYQCVTFSILNCIKLLFRETPFPSYFLKKKKIFLYLVCKASIPFNVESLVNTRYTVQLKCCYFNHTMQKQTIPICIRQPDKIQCWCLTRCKLVVHKKRTNK